MTASLPQHLLIFDTSKHITMNADEQPMDVDIINNLEMLINWVAPPSLSESSTGLYSVYSREGGLWVIHSRQLTSNIGIELFHKRWPPSRTSAHCCAWIAINCGISPVLRPFGKESYEKKFRMDVGGLRREFAQLVEGGGKVTGEMIDMLAVRYGVLSGKWLIYENSDQVDQRWNKVMNAVASGRGYGQAKVSTRKAIEGAPLAQRSITHGAEGWGRCTQDSSGHVICTYVDDYTDKQDVDELRNVLRLQAGVFWEIGFKPDAYTYLGIYQNNPWGLMPTRYHDRTDNKIGEMSMEEG